MKILLIKATLGALSAAVVALTLHTAPVLTLQSYDANMRAPLSAISQSIGQYVSGLFRAR